MTNRIRIAAMAMAAALAVSGSPAARADNHGGGVSPLEVTKFRQDLQSLSDKQLNTMIKTLKSRVSTVDSALLRAQLRAARQERRRRKAATATPSKPSTAAKLTQKELQARNLLRGAADAKTLRTPALENRIQSTRQLLKGVGLQDTTRTRLSTLLSGDRAELSRRQSAAQPVSTSERKALALLKGAQASTLRTPALEERIRAGRSLLASGQLTAATRSRLTRFVAADRSVLQARLANQQTADAERRARSHLDNAVPSSQLRAPALRERIRQSNVLLAAQGVRPATRQELANLIRSDRTRLDNIGQQVPSSPTSTAERRARTLLDTSVSPDNLNGATLRERISDTRTLLREPGLTRRTRLQLQARLDSDLAELNRRGTGQGGTNYADQQARQLLNDTRRAADLPERVLQQRLSKTRDLLQDPQLSQTYSRRLRARLSSDRRELRRRVIARRSGGSSIDIEVVIGTPSGSAKLLADRRPSSALTARELSNRVRHAQLLLNRGGLSSYNRSLLADRLVSDRRELRRRLRARRDQRRVELERKRRNNEINIVVAPRIEFAPRDDVAAAEADDETLERQLIAPPTREIDRRYTMDEFRRRPDLRSYMPAIEVDSIRFGTNEDFVREEEIDELERIGEIIERVIATNPDEVFLIEGHTDAVGSDSYNLSLSNRRAEAVKNALLEFFVIKPENLSTIGYGEQFLKIPTAEAEQENRRVSVRRITPLLSSR